LDDGRRQWFFWQSGDAGGARTFLSAARYGVAIQVTIATRWNLGIAADRNVRAPPRFHWGVTNALNFQLTKLRAYVVLSRNSRRRAMYDANQKGSACPFAFSAFRFSLLLCLALLGGSMFSGCATTSDNHRGTESSAEQQPGLSCWEKLGAYLCWTAQEMTYGFFSSNGGGVVGK